MHEAEKQGAMHHFSPERGPAEPPPGPGQSEKCSPGGRRGLRTPARKPNEFGSRTQTPGPEIQKVRPGRRRGLRTPARKPTEFGSRTQTPGPIPPDTSGSSG